MSTRVLWSTPTALVRLIPTYIHCQKCKTRFLIAFLKLFRSLYNCVKQFLAILKYHRNLSDMWIQKQSNVKQIPAFLRFSKCGLSIRLSDSQDLLDQRPVLKKLCSTILLCNHKIQWQILPFLMHFWNNSSTAALLHWTSSTVKTATFGVAKKLFVWSTQLPSPHSSVNFLWMLMMQFWGLQWNHRCKWSEQTWQQEEMRWAWRED